MLRSAY